MVALSGIISNISKDGKKKGFFMKDVSYVQIEASVAGQRLDNYLIRILKGVPKSYIYRLIRTGQVRINKKRVQPSSKLLEGDFVRLPPVRTASEKPIQVNAAFETHLLTQILFEDENLMVLNKPTGLAVHGGSGVHLGVIEALRHIRQDLPYLELVHRLDKETSGCILLAKKRSILRKLQSLFEEREVQKIYWALLYGRWKGKKVQYVDVALSRETVASGERIVRMREEGKASKTRFVLLKNYSDACFVEASPKTGRTHQIRVHSASLGHPIIGDAKYASTLKITSLKAQKKIASRLYLHARAIQFTLDNKVYHFIAEPDERFYNALDDLEITNA